MKALKTKSTNGGTVNQIVKNAEKLMKTIGTDKVALTADFNATCSRYNERSQVGLDKMMREEIQMIKDSIPINISFQELWDNNSKK